jgi:formylmethanofuran dehydrogenase subunit B
MSIKTFHDVPCPFCSLLCDDLVIKNQNGSLKVRKNGCHRAISHFEQARPNAQPLIKGKATSLDDAISYTSAILRKASQPLIAGLGTDVNGMRSAIHLAERTGAIIDHMHSAGIMRNLRVVQDHGWIMTTLSEIKNRADLIIFAGTDGIKNFPRFFERVIWHKDALFNKKIRQREIVYIGEKLDTSAGKNPAGRQPVILECRQEQIGEIISTLHALVVGNTIRTASVAGIKIAELETLAEKLKKASYGVLVWAPGELDFPHAELTVRAFCELIKYLNRVTRFAGFSLGGNDGGISAMNVATWQSGYPLRVSYSKGYPEYDPYKYSTRNVLRKKEVDAMIWISSFSTDTKPPRAKIPTVILSTPLIKLDFRPDVFIPTGTPGLDHKGQLFRTDSVVSLPLKQINECRYPSVSIILSRVLNSLQAD